MAQRISLKRSAVRAGRLPAHRPNPGCPARRGLPGTTLKPDLGDPNVADWTTLGAAVHVEIKEPSLPKGPFPPAGWLGNTFVGAWFLDLRENPEGQIIEGVPRVPHFGTRVLRSIFFSRILGRQSSYAFFPILELKISVLLTTPFSRGTIDSLCIPCYLSS